MFQIFCPTPVYRIIFNEKELTLQQTQDESEHREKQARGQHELCWSSKLEMREAQAE